MYRQIITPENTKLILQIPSEFVGHQIEVIAFPVDEKKKNGEKYSLEENRKFYSKFRFGTLRIKFSREELYDR